METLNGISHTADSRPVIAGCGTLPPMLDGETRKVVTTDKRPPKQTKQVTKDRFNVLNSFVDFTMRELLPSERIVWFVLYRDVRNGIATVSQADVARRSGLTQSTVSHAIKRLVKRDLVRVVRQGGFRKGLSTYRIRGSV